MKSYFTDLNRIEATTSLPVDYILKNPKSENLIILLHGFSQSAQRIFQLLEPALPKDACILALNGLFPMPQRQDNKYLVGFSWYMYDNFTDEYLVDQKPSSLLVKSLVETLGLNNKRKTIVGYSQGGYLAPFVAEKLNNVERVVGISCEFLKDEIAKPNYVMDALHGEDDDVVDAVGAAKSHGKLVESGVRGSFTLVKKEGHKLTPGLLKPLIKILEHVG